MKKCFTLFFFTLLWTQYGFSQSELSVPKIMKDPAWMGTFPSNIRWDEKGETIYFNYNKEKDPADSLYKISLKNTDQISKVGTSERHNLIPSSSVINKDRTKKIYVSDQRLMSLDVKTQQSSEVLHWNSSISNPQFLGKGNLVAFESENNIYLYHLDEGNLRKLTNIKSGDEPKKKESELSEKESWLKKDNLDLLAVIREREEKKEDSESYRKAVAKKEPYTFFTGKRGVTNMSISPDTAYVTFALVSRDTDTKRTNVPDYTDASSYTVNLPSRPKVGEEPVKIELAIYDLKRDTVYMADLNGLQGIEDLPDYVTDYPDREWKKEARKVIPSKVYFSDNSQYAVLSIRSQDNKDRWIASLNMANGEINTLDRQRDEAWIAGPGLGYSMGGGTFGWLPDNRHIYFQSEESGYSHLYLIDVTNGTKKALTEGNYEVFDPFISLDSKSWYFTSSEVHPGERHFYRMPLMGGRKEKLTTMEGNNNVALSPDEKHLAILFSDSNNPWELYLQPINKQQTTQLTSGQTEEFKAYNWRKPELIRFEAQDGAMVPARLYVPAEDKRNGAAVIFVHGAGYLQNVHKWWSSYFREYMFHNLLTDLGYTVLDIDYRGSAGYGRDWRTGIYRHMGGKDLSDQVDGVRHLVSNYNVNPDKIGIYGGSYGGFITLMALFNEPGTFKAGAALRSVTDWAHYNHPYTSNILNEPYNDPIAYRRSSPIYFAEGLEGNLLIAHGMVDVNVHFQDVVRLAQRLIELEKDNWEMALYPVEDHGFVEPSSWTDEYKRILKLFNETLLK
ncbi:S9 family peptidase [Anditalea andensis]|uniref:Peptidase S9 n=1 Tax=Anditalea andensis TaxID=1048983 RepID=A0A074L0R5_9BACT|nr:prolyl oligopeptidase family serine peptidase [Anditalea andensis]KEO74055.1 peptidase S9 [Anditalea andensis]